MLRKKIKNLFQSWLYLFFCGAATLSHADHTILFPSKQHLENALNPLSFEEVTERIAYSPPGFSLSFNYDNNCVSQTLYRLRNSGTDSVLETELYKSKTLSVFYPKSPRVPNHLSIAFHRDVRGVRDLSEEENNELFTTVRKIAEIYKAIGIHGFVMAQYDTPQEGHSNRYVVEIIPHLPGFASVKNLVDKVDCNRYVLFRTANLSPIKYAVGKEEIISQSQFWQEALLKEHPPLLESDIKIPFPHTRKESHLLEAGKLVYNQVLEIFQDRGAFVTIPDHETVMPLDIPEEIKTITVEKCPFCQTPVIERQLVYEYEDVCVLYNMRKGAKPGSCFLLIPKRHTEKIYGLSSNEIHNMYVVRKALVQLLKEMHPECEVIIYTQDSPSVGQTVFHTHEQIVAVDPKTISMTWTLMTLYPSANVSEEEMIQVRMQFSRKLDEKLKESHLQEAI